MSTPEPLIRVMALHALAYCIRSLRRKHLGQYSQHLLSDGVVDSP